MSRAGLAYRIAIVVVAGVLAACSSATEDSLSDEAASALQDHMAAVRSAVEAEDAAAAQEALDTLRSEAQAQAEAGEITEQRLSAIEIAVANASNFVDDLGEEAEPEEPEEPESEADPTPTPMPTPTPATATVEATPDADDDATDGG